MSGDRATGCDWMEGSDRRGRRASLGVDRARLRCVDGNTARLPDSALGSICSLWHGELLSGFRGGIGGDVRLNQRAGDDNNVGDQHCRMSLESIEWTGKRRRGLGMTRPRDAVQSIGQSC